MPSRISILPALFERIRFPHKLHMRAQLVLPHLVRLLLATLMIGLYVVGCWSSMVVHVQAAPLTPQTQAAPHTVQTYPLIGAVQTKQPPRPYHPKSKTVLPHIATFNSSGISSARNSDGRLEVFAISSDGNVYHNFQNGANDAGGWFNLSSIGTPLVPLQGTPIVGQNSDGRLEIFALGSDHLLYHTAQVSANHGWGNWDINSLGAEPAGGFQGTPAVARNEDGRLEIFALGNDGNLYHDSQVTAGAAWNGWSSLGRPSSGLNGSPTAVSNKDGHLEVFILGGDATIYHDFQLSPNSMQWSGFSSLGGPSAGLQGTPTAYQNTDGRVELIAVGADNTLYDNFQCISGCIWHGFTSLGGPAGGLQGHPVLSRNSNGTLDVFILGNDNAMYEDHQNCVNCSWNGVTLLGSILDGLTGIPTAMPNQDGRLEVFALDTNNGIQDNYQCKSGFCGSNIWNGFASLVTLSVTSVDGLGERDFYKFYTQRINGREDLRVNVASGNLELTSTDLQIKGTGIDLLLASHYNSRGDATSELGNNWVLSTGADLHLRLNGDGSVNFFGSSGYSVLYLRNSDGSYAIPPGVFATLAFNGGNHTYTLRFHRTGEVFTFDSAGFLTSEADQNHNTITLNYNGSHQVTSITDTQGRSTTFTYNGNNLTTITDPAGRTVTYGYTNNRLTSLTDLNNKTTNFAYTNSQLTQVTDPLGNATKIGYDSHGLVASITDARSSQTTFDYDPSTANACSGVVTPALPCTLVTDGNGHTTTFAYTDQDQVGGVKDANGNITTTNYTTDYNVESYSDALANTSSFNFSTGGGDNLTSTTDGAGAITQLGYGDTNHPFYPTNQVDPQGNTTNYAYDSSGNFSSASNPKTNATLSYTHNGNGTVATEKDANGNVTTFGYDAHGNLISVTPPSPLGSETLNVDTTLSRVNSVTDGNRNTTAYQYDTLDRVIKMTYAGGAVTTYSYDANGNLLKQTDNTGTTSFTYDALNRLKTKTLPGGTVITTAYDNVGNVTSLDDGGGAVTYGYDPANRMTTLTNPDGSQTIYTYDVAGHKTKIQYPNGTGMTMTYDKAGHVLTSIGGTMAGGSIQTTFSSFSYTYQANGKQTAMLQSVDQLDPVTRSATDHRAYTYDAQNRLTVADVTQSGNEVQKWTYGYDAAGNRVNATVLAPSTSTSYTYNGGNELQTKTQAGATTTYSYDGNGNLTGSSPGGTSFTYNAKNQTKTAGPDTYTYSGADQNDRVQVNSDTFVYSGLGLSAKKDASGVTHYVRCTCGLLNNERTPDGKTYYYLFDGEGSIVGMTDANGHEVNRYDYDPYGVIINQQEQSGINNPWKYAGGYLDSSTGLYKFGVRYYDATLGRWTQQDPVGGSLGDLGAANRYVYANDDPVNMVDPSGKGAFWDCFWAGVDTVALGFSLVITLATVIITVLAPNAITVFFAIIGVLLVAAAARSLWTEIHACYS